MKSFGAVLFLIAALVSSFSLASPATAEEANWDCYNPKPGHPTAAEKKAFVARLQPVAKQLQAELGIPAGGILAMSVQESGYGWTRTALNANNLFGWKFGKSARDANLGSWMLECQPENDPGKVYAAFSTWEDSIRFVARQLARSLRYSAATASAKTAIEAGKNDAEVSELWLKAIQQSGYNPNPNYPADVMNAGRSAGVFAAVSASSGSSPPVVTTVTEGSQLSASDAEKVLLWFKRDEGGRYWFSKAQCTPEKPSSWPGYESLPAGAIQKCRYTVTSCIGLKADHRTECEQYRKVVGPKSATVVLLEAGAGRMARWIASACAEAGGDRDKCLRAVYAAGLSMSSWQLPIAGLGFEDMDAAHYVQVGYAFRDGLTVRADTACGWKNGHPGGEAPPPPEQDAACSMPGAMPAKVSFQSRPVATTRSDMVAYASRYASELPNYPESFPIPDAAADKWRSFVRNALVSAYSSDKNLLVSAKAVSLRKKGAF